MNTTPRPRSRRALSDDLEMTAAQRGGARVEAPSSDQIDAVLRATRALVGIAAASMASVDANVTMPQWRVLVMVDTRGPLNLAAVAAGLDVNPSNASRICDRLIKAGWLDRQESPTDRRNITLSLTAAGRQLVTKVVRYRRRAITRVLRGVAPKERELIAKTFDSFATAAGESTYDAVSLIWPGG
jgi:DNA-binding MarR family transcriptional regulator